MSDLRLSGRASGAKDFEKAGGIQAIVDGTAKAVEDANKQRKKAAGRAKSNILHIYISVSFVNWRIYFLGKVHEDDEPEDSGAPMRALMFPDKKKKKTGSLTNRWRPCWVELHSGHVAHWPYILMFILCIDLVPVAQPRDMTTMRAILEVMVCGRKCHDLWSSILQITNLVSIVFVFFLFSNVLSSDHHRYCGWYCIGYLCEEMPQLNVAGCQW